MRGIVQALVAIALLAGGTAKATAQSLVELAIIMIVTGDADQAGNGPPTDRVFLTYHHFDTSAAFDEACAMSPDLQPVCDALASIEPGTPAARAIAVLARSGWEFSQAWPIKFTGPQPKADANAPPGLDVIFTAAAEEAGSSGFEVRQIGCDFSSGEGMTTLLQRAGDDDATSAAVSRRDDRKPCVDSLQDALSAGLTVRNAVEVALPGKHIFFPIVNADPGDHPGQAPRVGYAELYTLRVE